MTLRRIHELLIDGTPAEAEAATKYMKEERDSN